MKFIKLIAASVVLALAGCNDQQSIPVKPGASLNNVVGENSTTIGSCAKNESAGGEEEVFEHVSQTELLARLAAGKNRDVFDFAFEKGDIMFATFFDKSQGSGANVGGDRLSRYTSMPRADLADVGQWARHTPKRATGPNAQACVECHSSPFEDAAGTIALNVHRDPEHTGDPQQIIQRSTPHLFGLGALQLVAEEMTADLKRILKNIGDKACQTGHEANAPLTTKGVNYGTLTVSCEGGEPTVVEDKSKTSIIGIEPDLVVRPFEWKKSVAFVRDFMRGASHNEIGMQGVETVGHGVDGDGDGVKDELSIGDMTALAVYMAAQARPTTKLELEHYGLIEKLTPAERQQILEGEKLFGKSGIDCASCHQPQLPLQNTVFTEPSQSEFHRDSTEPGQNTLPLNIEKEGVRPEHAIAFNLAKDIPDNVFCQGDQEIHLGALEKENGHAVVRLYGDLKRHYLGDKLAEGVNEKGTGHMGMVPYQPVNSIVDYERFYEDIFSNKKEVAKATFGTKELWGVACTGPWLHDGRATTLREAIELHGGEAEPVTQAFNALDEKSKQALIAFLGNQVLYIKKAGVATLPPLSSSCELKELKN